MTAPPTPPQAAPAPGSLGTALRVDPRRPIDFELLSTTLRILETSSSWNETLNAVARLARASDRGWKPDSHTSDATIVRSFAAMLVRTGPLLRDALVCAAYAGGVRGADSARVRGRRERLLYGLHALSDVYNLRDLKTEDATRVVAEARRVLEGLAPLALPPTADAAPPALVATRSPRPWLDRLQQEIDAAFQASEQRLMGRSQALVERAWDSARGRIARAWLPGDTSETESRALEMFAYVLGLGPSGMIARDPSTMTVDQWTRVLHGAIDDAPSWKPTFAPYWMAPIAMSALGVLSEHQDTLLRLLTNRAGEHRPTALAEQARQRIRQWPWLRVGSPTEFRVLVVDERTPLPAWPLPARVGVLPLTLDQLESGLQEMVRNSERHPGEATPYVVTASLREFAADRLDRLQQSFEHTVGRQLQPVLWHREPTGVASLPTKALTGEFATWDDLAAAADAAVR